ncbi:hypothetical protein [Luteimonas deserti]|uniref:DUF2306 domain-containing protein n=1 Tax=Luteimonas deserti TaxID=2752306 RepID=A0A7Z0QNL1_9GAMM|nr:hypothetical protein [Luteimonas deserti]NYZ61914.1 hypothetical protein [Luteimonas deserti]
MHATTTARPLPASGRGRRFFALYAAVLLACVIAGFARTLYLRPWFDPVPLSPAMLAHGIAVTGWFVLFLLQTLLVRQGRLALHRQLGVLALAVALATLVTSCTASLGVVEAFRARGIDVDARRGLISLIVWGNLGALLAFAVFVVRGVLARAQADTHRRMMLLASIALISPALLRIAELPAFAGVDPVPATLLGLLAMLAYDIAVRRRPHTATMWGAPFFLFAHLGSAFLLPGTALDRWMLARIW